MTTLDEVMMNTFVRPTLTLPNQEEKLLLHSC